MWKVISIVRAFPEYLLSTGVYEDHIIEIALDYRVNSKLRDPDKILSIIKDRIKDTGQYYVLRDEVQMIEDFPGVMNSLLHIRNVDVYVTGSNSRFLSKDVVTEFRGRGQDIHMYPLSFSEYHSATGGDLSKCWRDYSTYGGLPQTLLLPDAKAKREYLAHLADTGYIADVVERHKVRNKPELDELLQILASSIGSPCNLQSAYAIPDEGKMIQETNSFRNIDDSFKRILIVKDDMTPYRNDEGILVLGLYDFLLDPELMIKG